MSGEPSVHCVIVNWNGWRDTIACLNSLSRIQYSGLSTIVVDNGSNDDSVTRIRIARPDARVVRTGRNLGFAGGNNVGIRLALREGADYVWLLNNDTEPSLDALDEMVKMAEANPQLGAVGSVLYYASAPKQVQAWGGGWINVWSGVSSHAIVAPENGSELDYLTAASMLVRAKAFKQIGLMDDRFFLYWEDAELCYRLRRHGWKLAVAAKASVMHKVNASANKTDGRVDRYFTTSGLRFLTAHAIVPPISRMIFMLLRISNRILRGKIGKVREVLRGFGDYISRDRDAMLPLG